MQRAADNGIVRAVFRFAVFSAAVAAYAADPTLLNFVPSDARVVSGVDVAKSRETPFGRYVLERMQPDDPKLREFTAAAGFDPNRDISEILSVSAGSAQNPTGLVIARGTFSPSKFEEAAKTAGAAMSQYHGIDILTYKGETVQGSLAFLDSSTAVVGDLEPVRAAIDRRRSPQAPPAELAAEIRQTAAGNDAWFVSTGSLTEFFSGKVADDNLSKALNGGLLASIQQASGGIQFGSDAVEVSAKLLTKSEKDARGLGDVLRFLASLIQPDPSKTGKSPVAEAMRTDVSGSVLRLSVKLPEAVIEQLFTSQAPAAAAPARGSGSR